jgi:hypothetical protein
LVAQPPQRHAVGAQPGTGDVLVYLGHHDALLQLGEQRLGLGQGKANPFGSEIVEATVKDANLIGCHLSQAVRASSLIAHSMTPTSDLKTASVSR